MTLSSPSPGPFDDDALSTAVALLRLPLARYWLYSVWYALACLGAASLWAGHRGRPLEALATGLAYLLCCGAALFVPGALIGAGSVAARLSPRRHRALLDGYMIGAASIALATILFGHRTATPVFILLVGNAILALDAQARETRRSCRAAREPRGAAI